MLQDLPESLIAGDLVLRRYRRSDAAAVLEAVVESGRDLSRYETWASPGFSIDKSAEYVGWWVSGWQDGTAYYFAIWRKGTYLGSCGLSGIERSKGRAGLGFWVRSSATGVGVATAAAAAVVEFAFGELGLQRVELEADVENLASRRVAAKVGAREQGNVAGRLVVDGGPRDAVISVVLRQDVDV